jgi:hypothetical protein
VAGKGALRKTLPVTDAELRRRYEEEETSLGTLAREYGVSDGLIRSRILDAGGTLRPPNGRTL